MNRKATWYVLLALALLLCAGCAAQTTPVPPSPVAPAPTIASQAIQATPLPQPSIYLWPTYMPDGMRVSQPESHVANPHEIGASGLGFYVMVLNGNNQKLSIGGGEIKDTIPITGDERNITIGERSGKLITSGIYREIIFDVPRGKLFFYSAGLSEAELLKVAGSLQPIDVQALRGMVGS